MKADFSKVVLCRNLQCELGRDCLRRQIEPLSEDHEWSLYYPFYDKRGNLIGCERYIPLEKLNQPKNEKKKQGTK